MSAHLNSSKVVVVKKWTDSSITIDNILRADLEANNKGFLALLMDGRLFLTTWLNKKISTKVIEEVADGCWQRAGGESEVIITRQNGSLVRYSLHFDTGLSCSLQLSAPSLLALIRERDSSIRSLRNAKVWGHSPEFILLQPQSDRLVLLATNAGGCPSSHGVLRTAPLRTAHLCPSKVVAQPVTGAELYEYELKTCRLRELVSLGLQRVGAHYTEWGALACSSSGDTIAIVDTERHLYVTDFRQRMQLGKKGGVARSIVTLHQVIWPSTLQPSLVREVTLGLSDTLLTVFCLVDDGKTESHHYLSFDIGVSSLNTHHQFGEAVAIIPGTTHLLPDLFLTHDGVAMLMDEDASISSVDSEVDLGELLSGLREGLEEQSMAKVTEVKAMVEQGLSVFLASCNHQEDWVGLAEMRARQYGQLAGLLLGYIPQYAQNETSHAFALTLKYLATHHFSSILEEMGNVLKYIDDENISQMVLQMSEQVSFYLRSAESIQLPQVDDAQADNTELYDSWGDKPMKEVVENAVNQKCLKVAERYLQLKPWVYGTVTTTALLTTCIDVAREQPSEDTKLKVMLAVVSDYGQSLRQLLLQSDDLFEVHVVGRALEAQGLLEAKEQLAVTVVVAIHRTLPDLLTLPPRRWVELVNQAESSPVKIMAPITVGQVSSWSTLAMMLVLCDLFSYSGEVDMLGPVEGSAAWQYLLLQLDLRNLQRWLDHEFMCPRDDDAKGGNGNEVPMEESAWLDPAYRAPPRSKVEGGCGGGGERLGTASEPHCFSFNLLSEPLYASDVESSTRSHDSLDSVSVAPSECDTLSVQSFEMRDCREALWPLDQLWPITQAMVDQLGGGSPFIELLLNLLAKRGIFTTKERQSPEELVRRLLVSGTMGSLQRLKGQHPCQIPGREIHQVVLEHLISQDLPLPTYDHLGAATGAVAKGPAWPMAVQPFQRLVETKDRPAIFNACLTSLQVLVEHCHSPQELVFPAFLTMLYAPNNTLRDIFALESGRRASGQQEVPGQKGEADMELKQLCGFLSCHSLTPQQVMEGLLEIFPYLQKVFPTHQNDSTLDVTVYDLLSDTVPFDLTRLFTFQRHNRHGYDAKTKLPCWSDEEMVSHHGIHHSLDATYYLREGRPIYACASLLAAALASPSHSSTYSTRSRLEDFHSQVFGLALNNWTDRSVCSACVAVMLMAGLDVDMLRVVLRTAYQIYWVRTWWCGKLSHDKKRGHESLVESDVSCILRQLCTMNSRAEAATALMEMLEACLIISASNSLPSGKEVQALGDLLASGLPLSHVVEALGKAFYTPVSQQQMQVMCDGMRLCVELAFLYKLPWPLRLLTKLAEANQWLSFLVVVQAFNFPKAEVLKVVESFSSAALREHMALALTHICYYWEGMERSRRSVRSKRSALYAKIGINSREGSPSPGHSGDERGRSSSPSDVDVSVVDDALSCTTSETTQELGIDVWLVCRPGDLFSVMLTCHQQDNAASELVTAAASLNLPVLAVFAACYDKHIPGLCLSVWLYTQLPHEAKLALHQKLTSKKTHNPNTVTATKGEMDLVPLPTRNCCRACDISVLSTGLREQRLIILAHVAAGSPEVVSEGLKVFDQHSSLYYLLLAIQEAKTTCRQELITQLLGDSASAMHSEPEVDQPSASVGSQWLAAIVQDIIGTALDEYVTDGHQQCQLLLALTTVGQLPPFCTHSVNWGLAKQVCKVVGQARHKINYRKLLWSFETGEVKDVVWKVAEDLRDRRCFSEALQVCQLVDLPVFTIVCGQLRAEFENSKQSIKGSYCGLEKFLLWGHELLCEKTVPPEYGCAFFATICEEVPLSAMQYLCLQYSLVWHYKTLENTAPHDLKKQHTNAQSSPPQGPYKFCSQNPHSHVSHSPHLHSLYGSPSHGPYPPYPHNPNLPLPHSSHSSPHAPRSPPSHASCSSPSHPKQPSPLQIAKTQPGVPHKSIITKLEQRMWEAYIHSFCDREIEAASLLVTLPEVLGSWPWEEENGNSCLDVSQVLSKAGLTHAFLTLSPNEVGGASLPGSKENRGAWRSFSNITNREETTSSRQSRDKGSSTQTTTSDEKGGGSRKEHSEEEEEDRQLVIQELVDTLVERGLLVTACRVLSAFRENNENVQRLLLVLRLAEEGKAGTPEREAGPTPSSSHWREKQSTLSRSSTLGSFCSTSSLEEDLSIHITPLTQVVAGLAVGRRIAERVIVLYKVALALDLSYLYVVHHSNPITLLSLVLRLHRCGTTQLARDLINVLPISQAGVQAFLVEEAVATITAGPEATRSSQRDSLLLWEELEAQWKDLITLSSDPSGLATQLLDVGQCLGSSYPDQVEKVHSMSVELVVRAHDCFTAASNMEGIGSVLRTALSLTTSLVQHAQWSLLVRLLIGIGRYSEMSYIIDILREHGQFEPLLGRGSDPSGKETGLDRALIHYLRSKAPEDTETLHIVALHFLLYSEVAEMWVAEAEKAINEALGVITDLTASQTTTTCTATTTTSSSSTLSTSMTSPRGSSSNSSRGTGSQQETPSKGRSPQVKGENLTNTSMLRGQLESLYLEQVDHKLLTQAMQSFAHAAQCFMQDQQFASAMDNSRQAELVALQLAHARRATPALRLLKLSRTGVSFLTTHKLRVGEAQLVGRAYAYAVDWGAALYYQFVHGGDETYLVEYLATFTLTPEVMLNVVKKLEHEGITREKLTRVAALLAHVEESDTVYRVASQLGLKGSIDACLASPAAPYLKDTVFVQGCTAAL